AHLVGNRRALDAEELADEDRQKPRGAAGLAGEDLADALLRVDRGALVDEQARRPVAAAHIAGDFHDQPEIEPGEIDVAEMARVDPEPRPGLAVSLRRRVLAERQDAGAEDGAVARQHQLPFHRPTCFGHRHLLGYHETTSSAVAQTSSIVPASRVDTAPVVSFSTRLNTANSAIQKMFMSPTANITSIS